MAKRLRYLPVAAVALAASAYSTGCGGGEGPAAVQSADPTESVRTAGIRAMEQKVALLDLHVESGRASYDAEGPIELGKGRFKVELSDVTTQKEDSPRPEVVIGTDGEGFENTFEENYGLFGTRNQKERCWFNPHSPVGSFLGTASVEETVRVTSAVVESLEDEIRSAEATGESYEVELKPSASEPHSDFRETERRIWGARKLLNLLHGPINVALSDDGSLESVAFEIEDYRPYLGTKGRQGADLVQIAADYGSTEEKLVLDPPSCMALE